MSELAPLISDLALILICAGVMTLVFKRLKQPLVLGYIVAGFLASPHVPLTPSVIDVANIHTWSEIGVIFLLFALGLEFSFKKLVKVGGTAVIAACTIIFCMILVGIFVGWSFGWQRMDCLYLGGMLAMSSTTIIYKAFDDLGLRQLRRCAGNRLLPFIRRMAQPHPPTINSSQQIIDTDNRIGIQTYLIINNYINGRHNDTDRPQPNARPIFKP